MTLTQQQISRITEIFQNRPVLKAYVFGSYARNTASADSDVDILVDLDYSHHIGLEFVRIQRELEEELLMKVDLVSSQGLSRHIKPYIDGEKQMIYERV